LEKSHQIVLLLLLFFLKITYEIFFLKKLKLFPLQIPNNLLPNHEPQKGRKKGQKRGEKKKKKKEDFKRHKIK
jgi:hypothetical protein